MSDVRIHYVRPPGREEVYIQRLVHRDDQVLVTLNEHTPLRAPIVLDDEVVLEPGSPVLWFTFPGAWHDVGRFHRADGRFTGIYANILEPVELIAPTEWRAVDLFLDVWVASQTPGAEGPGWPPARLLDEDELEEALARGWIAAETGRAARREAERLLALARQGRWPPPIVHEWTLERARAGT